MPTQRIIKGLGWLPDLPDARDRLHTPTITRLSDGQLPPRHDLTEAIQIPVYDQDQLGSCTAQSVAFLIDQAKLRQGMKPLSPSRLFLYYNTRVLENTVQYDSGASIRNSIKAAAAHGSPAERYAPYKIERFARQPSRTAYTRAERHQALTYERVPQVEEIIKATLVSGRPITFGFAVYQNLYTLEVNRTGVIPMPAGALLGGHAVALVGYDDSARLFKFRNSWGDWGAAGHGFLPYSFLLNPQLAADFWVINQVE